MKTGCMLTMARQQGTKCRRAAPDRRHAVGVLSARRAGAPSQPAHPNERKMRRDHNALTSPAAAPTRDRAQPSRASVRQRPHVRRQFSRDSECGWRPNTPSTAAQLGPNERTRATKPTPAPISFQRKLTKFFKGLLPLLPVTPDVDRPSTFQARFLDRAGRCAGAFGLGEVGFECCQAGWRAGTRP